MLKVLLYSRQLKEMMHCQVTHIRQVSDYLWVWSQLEAVCGCGIGAYRCGVGTWPLADMCRSLLLHFPNTWRESDHFSVIFGIVYIVKSLLGSMCNEYCLKFIRIVQQSVSEWLDCWTPFSLDCKARPSRLQAFSRYCLSISFTIVSFLRPQCICLQGTSDFFFDLGPVCCYLTMQAYDVMGIGVRRYPHTPLAIA